MDLVHYDVIIYGSPSGAMHCAFCTRQNAVVPPLSHDIRPAFCGCIARTGCITVSSCEFCATCKLPLLFLIYINDLTTLSDKMLTIMLADDTSIFIQGNNIHEMEIAMNSDIKRLSIWLKINKRYLNKKKLIQ